MSKYEGILSNIFNTFIKILLFILLMLALLNMLVIKDNIEWDFNYNMIFSILIIYSLIIFFIMKYYLNKRDNNCKRNKIIKKISIGIIFIMQLVYAILIRRSIGFDSGVIYGSAIDLVNGTFTNSEYFSRYGNNVFLLLGYEIIFRIVKFFGVESYLVVQIIINILMIDIALIYIYKTCKKMFDKKYCKICNILSIPMLGLTPYIAVAYSDTLSLIFPISIFYNYLSLKLEDKNKKRLIYITILAIIGFLIKPTNVIILIAIFIYEFFEIVKPNSNVKFNMCKLKECIKNIIYVFITIMLVYGGFNLYKNVRLKNYISNEQIEDNSFPMTHFFMMGLKPIGYEGKYYGCYLEEDVQATQSLIGAKAKKEYNINESINRLKAMGIKGYFKYLYDKYTWIISDGTFFYGREGNFYTAEPNDNSSIGNLIQNYAYYDRQGYKNVTINIYQSLWIVVLLAIILDIIISFRKKENAIINVLRISIIGIILFILLFEARSRYLMNYLPIFITLGVSGIINMYKLITKSDLKLISGDKDYKGCDKKDE